MSRRLLYAVGPSGVGKDSLLTWLSGRLEGDMPTPVHIARRTITRPEDAGNEAHEPLSPEAFSALQAEGAFAMDWAANGLQYGIRRAELAGLADGAFVIVNGSRAYVPALRRQWPGVCVVHIEAPASVVRERLRTRGRETADAIEARVARSQQLSADTMPGDLHISNAGSLEDSGHALLALLQEHMRQAMR
jgi:ribose 1,5-bisphosphokinase